MKFSNVAAATVLASTSSACILPIVEGLLNCVFPRPPPPTIPPSPCGGKNVHLQNHVLPEFLKLIPQL